MDWGRKAPNFQDVTEKTIGVIQRAGLTDAEAWADALGKGNFFAFVEDVAFLLSRTGGLINLHLGLAHKWEKQLLFEHADYRAEGLRLISSTVNRLSVVNPKAIMIWMNGGSHCVGF